MCLLCLCSEYPMTVKSISLSDTTSTWRKHKQIYDEDMYYVDIGCNCLSVHMFFCLSVWCMYLDIKETSVVMKVMPRCIEWRSRAGPMIHLWLVFSESRDRYMPFIKWGHPLSLLNSMSKHVQLIVCPMILKLNNLSIRWMDSSKCRKRYSINVWRTVKAAYTTHHASHTTHHTPLMTYLTCT